MQTLKQNMINAHGVKGEAWVNLLPTIIDFLCKHWNLYKLIPVDNMSYHYVAKATTYSNLPVVLKIGCDEKIIAEERQALKYFDGGASIRLIDYHSQCNALLLQQAVPGISLKSLYPERMEYVMDCYLSVTQKLHEKEVPNAESYRHVKDWLKAIDNLAPVHIPNVLLEKAFRLKNELLSSSKREVFLHGDLHHDNILQNDEQWLAIDPKGIIGEPEFEIAAFDFIRSATLDKKLEIKKLFEQRVELIAEKSKLNCQRIKDWVFVRLILFAAWAIEDNGDPSWAINLAKLLK